MQVPETVSKVVRGEFVSTKNCTALCRNEIIETVTKISRIESTSNKNQMQMEYWNVQVLESISTNTRNKN